MASVAWEGGKHKGGAAAKAQFRHDAQDTREQDEHSNEHLDTGMSYRNTAVRGLSYAELCKEYDERIAYLDATTNRNKRKDRVTMVSAVIPTPVELSESDSDAWFGRVWELASARFGKDNMLDLIVHRDELHEFRDAVSGEQKTSRVHGHLLFVPERDGQLNSRGLVTKASIISFNNAIDEMSQREFGVRFLDGTGRRGGRAKVEDLKRRSRAVEQEFEELEAAKAKLAADREALDARTAALRAAEEGFQRNKRLQEEEAKKRIQRISERETRVSEREAKVAEREAEVERREQIAARPRPAASAPARRSVRDASDIKLPTGMSHDNDDYGFHRW